MKGQPEEQWDLSDSAEPPKYTSSWYDWRAKRKEAGQDNKPVEEVTRDEYRKRTKKA